MPTFQYRAKKGLNDVISGVMEAENKDMVVSRLSESGLIAVSVEEKAPEKIKEPTTAKAKEASKIRRKKLTPKDLNIFTQQLKTLLRARVELLMCLSILYKQADNALLKEMILEIHNSVKDGKTFSESLNKYPNFFPQLYVNIIRAGETSGRLDESLAQLGEYLIKEQDFRMKVTTALAYPAMMILVGVGTIFVLFSFVIPRLSSIFSDFNAELPLPTRILLVVSGFMQKAWPLILALIAGMVFLIRQKKENPLRQAITKIKMRLPVLGELMRKQAISRFTHTLALLLHSGIPVYQSLKIATPTLENKSYMQQLDQVHKDVLGGSNLATSMSRADFIPPFIIQMITVGEAGGRLEEVLHEITDAYNQETEIILKIITSLLEPAVILVLGLVLGLIIMGMLLPIFQINMLVK